MPDAVANAITGSTPEDVECLDEILSAGAWDDVQQCVRGLAMQGRVTPGVLAAAEKVLAKMQERSDADIDVVKVRTTVCKRSCVLVVDWETYVLRSLCLQSWS